MSKLTFFGDDSGGSTAGHDSEPAHALRVMGTGWFAAGAANVRPGSTVAVVGDGAVGPCGFDSRPRH